MITGCSGLRDLGALYAGEPPQHEAPQQRTVLEEEEQHDRHQNGPSEHPDPAKIARATVETQA
ncbi:hypothetical protein [Kocuria arenosa]|uniref:hypothetical protein n=1 Tax=Kocuria arenosa TaxID=3071446 RepID=UPI0034D4913D